MSKKIRKVLIANRGEIAVRVIRSCRELGIATVAVYSEVDRRSPHVLIADQAVEIGPAAPLESYLNIDRLLAAARQCGCDAVHPGYGFLSENPRFARRCQEAGLVFIGPTPEAMETLGDKLTARQTMIEAGVPVTPGSDISGGDWEAVHRKAEEIGYPVMVKASAGGGGKGMRIVRQTEALRSAVEASRREAQAAFDNDTVYLEKYLEKPRHVEFQVVADHHGQIVHLFERECSIQRRHQKIVEETPATVLDESLRREMGETACRVMQAVNYRNAGTVEFLLDQDKNFYFLEVNARLQVEHPVTELVTGVDLVKLQLAIAAGEPLPFRQEDLQQSGHAIECRIYAEDPQNSFFPSTGKLLHVREPQGPGIRCDSGIYSGLEISHHYDPILSKLIVWGEDRSDALRRMTAALNDYVILGVKTPIAFLKDLINHPRFVAGDTHTGFIDQHLGDWQTSSDDAFLNLALLTAAYTQKSRALRPTVTGAQKPPTPWQILGEWEQFS